MKILSADQIRELDDFTIANEPVSALNLMERAAKSCAEWLHNRFRKNEIFYLFCGTGNNGGDGFGIARLLYEKGHEVHVFSEVEKIEMSGQTESNLKKAEDISDIKFSDFGEVKGFRFKNNAVLVDALFGTGLNRKVAGKYAGLIKELNHLNYPKIAIDIASGLFADGNVEKNAVVFKADETLSFQFWKKSFLHPETGKFCGKIHILDIGLSSEFIENEPSESFVIDDHLIRMIYEPRNEFSNKGTFGRTLIVAGSFGKIGAAVLATKSALKSGSGLTITCSPKCGYEILQTACPEAMFISGGENFIIEIQAEENEIVGIGPGLGMDKLTAKALFKFLETYSKPLILDADALNIFAKNPENLKLIPKNSIITPHPKEFERLFGKTDDSFLRLDLARKKAKEFGIFIILKDHHTQVVTPDRQVFYNITGNSGMAKGGSGDALLGMVTALLAQNYSSQNAALFAVWIHGKAGDLAAEKFSKEAMLPTDLIEELGNVFKSLA